MSERLNEIDEIPNVPSDEYDPEEDPRVAQNPFHGAIIGVVRMGTLANVLGAERAKPILDELEAAERRMARAVRGVLRYPHR